MSNPDMRLKVDGTIYGGWKQITVRRSLEQLAASFELVVSERWAGQDTVRPIRPGAACTLLVNNSPVIVGYVDDVNIEYGDKQHQVAVSGYDKTGDLVGCSAPSTQFSGRTLAQVATDLCKPFGIGVKVNTDIGGQFSRLKNNEGDSVFETLESAARIRAVLLLSDGLGNLVLSRAGTQRISEALELGKNIYRASGKNSHRDRFSRYEVKGQMAGSDEWYAEDAAHPLGTSVDKPSRATGRSPYWPRNRWINPPPRSELNGNAMSAMAGAAASHTRSKLVPLQWSLATGLHGAGA